MTEQQARDFALALGAEVAHWRRQKKLSRADLAHLVGVSETTIGRIERGSEDAAAATADTWRIAAALGLTFADLVRRAEDAMSLSDRLPKVANYGDEEAGAPEE